MGEGSGHAGQSPTLAEAQEENVCGSQSQNVGVGEGSVAQGEGRGQKEVIVASTERQQSQASTGVHVDHPAVLSSTFDLALAGTVLAASWRSAPL